MSSGPGSSGPGSSGPGSSGPGSSGRGSGAEVVPGVRLDALTRADAHRCAELEAILFPGDDPWSAVAFTAEVDAGYHYLAARRGADLVGYAGVALLPAAPAGPFTARGPAEAEVHTIGVDPAEQGRGIGGALLRALLAAADGIGAVVYLEVRTDNAPALALYAREGFVVVGTRRHYYASGVDAHTMRRTPPDAPSADPR